jgi:hypothetical protein
MTLKEAIAQSRDMITLIYIIKDSHIHKYTTKDGKTYKIQSKECIGVLMPKSEFKKKKLKARHHSGNVYFSTRKIVVTCNSNIKADLCRQGFIRLGLIPEPDLMIKISMTPEVTLNIPVVESNHKRLTFLNDDRDKKILLALVGKTLVCTGHNTFKILDK